MRRGPALAKVTIRIRHVSWRGGRPRFQPGPKLRKLGLKGEDLKHPDDRWYTAEEAQTWIVAKVAEIEGRRAARAAGLKPPRVRRPGVVTVADLFDKLWASPKFNGGAGPSGRILAEKTIADYRSKAAVLMAYDADLAASDIRALTKPVLIGLHEKLWTEKGHHMANGVLAVLRLALTYAERKGWITANPAMRLGLETPRERLRVGSIAEMTALLRAADAIGETMVGHSVMLGLMTGQRQGDRLALQDAGHEEGVRRFRQSKTGAVVDIPETPQLAARLAAAKAERERWGVKVVNILIDPKTRLPWKQRAYHDAYTKARDAAVAGVKDAAGAWLVEPCPSLADFREGDLRDTAVTWLAQAGCTVPMICSITGHDEQSAYQILKHYLAKDPEMARTAIGKLVVYLEAKGARL